MAPKLQVWVDKIAEIQSALKLPMLTRGEIGLFARSRLTQWSIDCETWTQFESRNPLEITVPNLN